MRADNRGHDHPPVARTRSVPAGTRPHLAGTAARGPVPAGAGTYAAWSDAAGAHPPADAESGTRSRARARTYPAGTAADPRPGTGPAAVADSAGA